MAVELELPFPPSVNHYYRHVGHRVLISRDGRRYREQVIAKLTEARVPKFGGAVDLHIELYPPDRRRRDADNYLKCLLDALAHGELYDDDSQIVKLTIIKRDPMPPNGMAIIRIQPWNKNEESDIVSSDSLS